MKILKFNESSSQEIDKETLLYIIEDIEDEISEVEFTVDELYFDEDNDYGVIYSEYDGDGVVDGVGFLLCCNFNFNSINSYRHLDKFTKLLNMLNSLYKRLEDSFDCKCLMYIESDVNSISISIRKNYTTKEDYYFVFMKEIAFYTHSSDSESPFISFNLENIGEDYFVKFKTDSDMNKEGQLNVLVGFVSEIFEPIEYDEFIHLSKKEFKLKNPKIKSIKFK